MQLQQQQQAHAPPSNFSVSLRSFYSHVFQDDMRRLQMERFRRLLVNFDDDDDDDDVQVSASDSTPLVRLII